MTRRHTWGSAERRVQRGVRVRIGVVPGRQPPHVVLPVLIAAVAVLWARMPHDELQHPLRDEQPEQPEQATQPGPVTEPAPC